MNSQEEKVKDFGDIPITSSGLDMITAKDIAHVEDATDIVVDYALVDGKRSVYFPIVKTASASTWDVVQGLRKEIPEMQSLLPEDVRLSYEFDQSVFVMNAAKSLMTEGILGALLTGLMVLLFLRDWRSSLVVIVTIPVAVLGAVLCLKLAGQTVNIMTLSGLALAIGILVDQATVTIENIHQHLEMNKPKRRAILRCLFRDCFPAAADPALYPGGVCALLCHDGCPKGYVPSARPFHRVCDDPFLCRRPNAGANPGKLAAEGGDVPVPPYRAATRTQVWHCGPQGSSRRSRLIRDRTNATRRKTEFSSG